MKKIKAEILTLPQLTTKDIEDFKEWVWQMRKLNLFDPDVMTYPRTVMLKASSEEETLLFMPLQAVLMWDSIAPKPGLSARDEALCLSRIRDQIDKAMELTGYKETYFFCADDRVAEFSTAHGFEEMKGVRLFKRKAKDINPR